MNVKAILASALALAVPAVPSLAHAQQPGGSNWAPRAPNPVIAPGYGPRAPNPVIEPGYEPRAPNPVIARSFTPLTIIPPAYGSVYLYDGDRVLGRFDGPGALWLLSGRVYGVVAMRGNQVLWSGSADAAGAPIELRWPAPPRYDPRLQCPYGYPTGPLTEPIERGRVRTPWP